MDSITKNLQTITTLRRMVERSFGPDLIPDLSADWLTELQFGMFNAAYRITLRDGTHVVLKVAPPPDVEVMTYEIGAMATELEALRLITEQTSVPVPAVLASDASRTVCDSDYFFMSLIHGDNLAVVQDSLTPAERVGYGEALGALNRDLNAIRSPTFGPLVGAGSITWREAFLRMVDEVLDDGERREVDLGWAYAVVRQTVVDHASVLDEVVEPRLVEWDLWPGNVLVHDHRIVGLLDHERAFWGDPLMEHGFNGLTLPAFGDPSAFVRGYGRAPLTPSEQIRRNLYGIHLTLIMIIETAYRDYTDPAPYRWAREQLDQTMHQLGHSH